MPDTIKIYPVKKGDYLAKIAKEHKTTINEIKTLNNLKSNMIHPGDDLKIKVSNNEAASGNTGTAIRGKGKKEEAQKKPEKPEKEKKEGYLVCEGATAFCSSAVTHKNKAAPIPLTVTSHKKFYIHQDKKIATKDDKTVKNLNFKDCQVGDKTLPCKARIKWEDYYKDLELNEKGALLHISKGLCNSNNTAGKIEFAHHGQTEEITNDLLVKDGNEYLIDMAGDILDATSESKKARPSVNGLKMTAPVEIAATKSKKKQVELVKDLELQFEAQFSEGDASLINWVIYKGHKNKKKIRTYIEYGQKLTIKDIENPEEGEYAVEAYGKGSGYDNCTVYFDLLHNKLDHISGVEVLLHSQTYSFTAEYLFKNKNAENAKENLAEQAIDILGDLLRVKNSDAFTWSITEIGGCVLYQSKINRQPQFSANSLEVINDGKTLRAKFINSGEYTIEVAHKDNPEVIISKKIKVEARLKINTITERSNALLRPEDMVTVAVGKINIEGYPGFLKRGWWYLQCNGVWVKTFVEHTEKINISATDLAAKAGNTQIYGAYKLQVYGEKIKEPDETKGKRKKAKKTNKPSFRGAKGDVYAFEIIKNSIKDVRGPAHVPLATTVTYRAASRIPIKNGEAYEWSIKGPENMDIEKVVNHNTLQITFKTLGEYEVTAALTGSEGTIIKQAAGFKGENQICVHSIELNYALWAYQTGRKRTQSGYAEETYAYVQLEGLKNLQIQFNVWIKHPQAFAQPDTYLLLEKSSRINKEGQAQIKFVADKEIQKKIENLYPEPETEVDLIFTMQFPETASHADIKPTADIEISNTEKIISASRTHYMVLDPRESLTLTHKQSVKSILFSNEAGTDVLRAYSTYGKTHKLWVHTVNMQNEKLMVSVYKDLPAEALEASYNIDEKMFWVADACDVKHFDEEAVGPDGLLELDFDVKPEWKEQHGDTLFERFAAVVFKKTTDAEGNEKIISLGSQIKLNNGQPFVITQSEDLKKMGILMPTLKAGQNPGAQQLLAAKRRYMAYFNDLRVVKEEPEKLKLEVVPVVVEYAEIERQKPCYCHRPFSVDEMKNMVRQMTGKEEIWRGIAEICPIEDKSFESLTLELNNMFSRYGIERCMQKMVFLAQLATETGFFKQTVEEKSDHKSSQSIYKGRGVLQITGSKDSEGYYNISGAYATYGRYLGKEQEITDTPSLIASNLRFAIDVGGWIFSKYKKRPKWSGNKEAIKWKREYFNKSNGGNTLNEIALLVEEEEEKYFYLISKLLNGYSPKHKLEKDPHGWTSRKDALKKLKNWFYYDKGVCDGSIIGLVMENNRAPWMVIAIREASRAKGVQESQRPLYDMATGYHNFVGRTGSKADPTKSSNAWCASFVSWVLSRAGYDAPKTAGSRIFINNAKLNKISTPIYGAIAVFSNCSKDGSNISSSGHVSFIYGKLPTNYGSLAGDGLYACLGGNQSNGINIGVYDCTGKVFKNGSVYKICRGLYVPKGYQINQEDYLTNTDSYDSTAIANKKVINIMMNTTANDSTL